MVYTITPYYFDSSGIARTGMTGMVRIGMSGMFMQEYAIIFIYIYKNKILVYIDLCNLNGFVAQSYS